MRTLFLASYFCLPGVLAAQEPVIPAAPLVFEPTVHAGEYGARAGGVAWRLAGATMVARAGGGQVTLRLVDARRGAVLEAAGLAPGVSHYFLGNDPARWRRHVPHYRELRARHARPGVDLVHRAVGGELEFDLVLQPGADATALALGIEAPASARLGDGGTVMIPLGAGELCLHAPVVFQQQGGRRHEVPCRYRLDGNFLRFDLGDHDPALELTIDPVVTYATVLGGAAGAERVRGVHVDQQGNLLVTGTTQASDFPLLANLPVTYRFDIGFVSKFDPAGALVFSTFFGGTSGLVTPVDIGADPNGQIVVGGNTTSPNLPTTAGVVQPMLMGGGDWFFVDLFADGTLAWCTYYGGLGVQGGMRALKVLDVALGSVLAVGNEGTFPFMTNNYSQQGGMVVAGIYAGSVLWASSACGFSGLPTAVDVTSQGHICITGTVSGNGSGLPTTVAGSFQSQPSPGGGTEGFVFVFTGQANSLVFATYFGGTGNDAPRRIVARPGPGTIVVTIAGDTSSTDLPLWNALQPQKGAIQDGFVAQLDGLTQTLNFSTYLGGSDPGETVAGLGIDSTGHIVVGGTSSSNDLPFTSAIKLPGAASSRDVCLWRLLPTGGLDWCTMWGGNGSELLVDLAIGPADEILVGGHVAGSYLPVTPNAFMSQTASQDAFLARIDPRSMVSYGVSTPGYNNFKPVLAGGGPRAPGTTALLQIHDGRAQAVGVLGAGFGRANIPFLNGAILTNPVVTLTVVLNGSTQSGNHIGGGGWLHTGFAIPAQPGLSGVTIDWQAAFLDANAVGGIALTNAVELVIQ